MIDQDTAKKWILKDLWYLEEFALLCCGLDPARPSEGQPEDYYIEVNRTKEDIKRGKYAGNLDIVDKPGSMEADRMYDSHFYFRPIDCINWGKDRFEPLQVFLPLLHLIPKKQSSSPASPLAKSEYWQSLESKMLDVVKAYPKWELTVNKVQKSGNLPEWLKQEFGLNEREKTIAGKILSDIYDF